MSIFRRLGFGAVAAAVGLWMSGCTHLFYQPSDLMYVPNPEQLEGVRQEHEFKSLDGVKLAAWYLPAQKNKPYRGLIVQFHGNAQNMTAHFAGLAWLTEEGYDLFTFDYRGYGISEGKPTPEGVNRDGIAAIRYALGLKRPSAGPKDVILYGQSLGGAILLRAFDEIPQAERARIKTVVIESSFHSYHAISRNVLSRNFLTFVFQPLAYVLVSNRYSPEEAIARISPIPLIVMHGDQDAVVPFKFGQKIYELGLPPKKFIHIKGGGHINSMFVDQGAYRPEFLKQLVELK